MENLFVYGSLRKGTKQSAQSRQGIGTEYSRYLEMHGTYVGAATAEGRMILLAGCPGFVDGSGTVLGDLYQVTTNVIKKLDKFEDIEFERLKRTVKGPEGEIEAWVYVYRFSPTGKKRIESGDWSTYQDSAATA